MKKTPQFVVRAFLAFALCLPALGQTTMQGVTLTGVSTNTPSTNPVNFNVTLASLTLPNVAACGSQSYCFSTFPPGGVNGGLGWFDNRKAPPLTNKPITNPVNPVALNINLSDLHALTTNTAPIFAHQQLWFANGGTGTVTIDGVKYPTNGSHLKNGYTSNDQAHSDAMVQHMWALGIIGGIGDWGGGPNTCGAAFTSACGGGTIARNSAYLKEVVSMQNLHPSMKFALMYDNNAFDGLCGTADANQAKCIQGKIDADLKYALTAFWNQPQYLTDPANGNPIVWVFDNEGGYLKQCTIGAPCNLIVGTCTSPTACWSKIWDGVNTYLTSTLGQAASFMFEQTSGFTHEQSAGAYVWLTPNGATNSGITTATQLDWQNGSFLSNFYNAAQTTYASKLSMGMVGKGFDPEEAPWKSLVIPNVATITSQQCGQVWLKKFALTNGKTNLKYIGIGVWDDYEEGSEIETGIQNCYAAPSESVAGLLLTATLNPTDAIYSSLSTTLDEELYASIDGSNFVLLDTKAPANTVTFDLTTYPQLNIGQTYSFRMFQRGQPGLENHISAALSLTR